jgi:hypothetical protein
MDSSFFRWAEPILTDNDALRLYYLSGQTPPDPHFDFLLSLYWDCYELELEAGLLDGAEMEY